MDYLPPFVVMGTHRMKEPEIEKAAADYGNLLGMVGNGGFEPDKLRALKFLNDFARTGA